MNALVIGRPHDLAGAVARGLRRRGRPVLQAIASDVASAERVRWLLAEAGDPELIVVFDDAPYGVVHALLPHTRAEILLVAEQRAALAQPSALRVRSFTPRDGDGLTVVELGRAGRRWFRIGAGRTEPLGAERAAAEVLRSCGAAAASSR
jgi:hypothetical protein